MSCSFISNVGPNETNQNSFSSSSVRLVMGFTFIGLIDLSFVPFLMKLPGLAFFTNELLMRNGIDLIILFYVLLKLRVLFL